MLLENILKQIKEHQEQIAYTVNSKRYTYKEFYKYVCNIYWLLLEKNNKQKPVLVYGHKDVYMKATFLACSLAGMAYIPVDISFPEDRIKKIIDEVNPDLIIGNFENKLSNTITQTEIEELMNKDNFKDIEKIYLKPEDVYYIIFTSGSTGIPKGVQVIYKNLDSCINWLQKIIDVKEGTVLNQGVFSFDLTVADLYYSLANGMEHFVIEKQTQSDFNKLFETFKSSNATLAVFTPSFADLLLLDKSFKQETMPNLKIILFCGEKLLAGTAKKIKERFKNIKIINSYGPTECTFAITSIEITQKMIEENDIPIGIPKSDVKIYIVDENLQEQSSGETGEILITGKSVAKGYIGENKGKFITYKGKNAYLTGDIGYFKNDKLYYVARKDKQIKYKGYRIELLDIEKNLYKLGYVEKAVAVAKQNKEGKVTKIIAFIKLKENAIKNEIEIKKDISTKLPQYMCPTIKIIERFPLNRNGKIDEKKLTENV